MVSASLIAEALALPGFFRLEHTIQLEDLVYTWTNAGRCATTGGAETHLWMAGASFELGRCEWGEGDTAEAACKALLAKRPLSILKNEPAMKAEGQS